MPFNDAHNGMCCKISFTRKKNDLYFGNMITIAKQQINYILIVKCVQFME